MVFTAESDQKPPVEFSKDETKAKEVDKHVAQCKYVMTKCVCLCVCAIVYTIIPGHNLSSIRWVLRRAVGRIVCLPRAAASAAAIRQPNRQSHWQYERWYTGVIGMTYYRDYLSAYRRPITEAPRCLDIWRTVVWKKMYSLPYITARTVYLRLFIQLLPAAATRGKCHQKWYWGFLRKLDKYFDKQSIPHNRFSSSR